MNVIAQCHTIDVDKNEEYFGKVNLNSMKVIGVVNGYFKYRYDLPNGFTANYTGYETRIPKRQSPL